MRAVFQKIGFCLILAGVVIWLLGGARKGFYVTSVEIPMLEPITEIEYTETHSKFLPGIETLGLGVVFGGSFLLLAFLFSKPSLNKSSNQS